MFKVSTSVFAYEGNANVTLNALTNTAPVTTKTLADLSPANFAENQAIFKNQPMTWWVKGLNAPASITYTPISNDVNWSFASGSQSYGVGMPISNLLIPNGVATSVVDEVTKTRVNTFKKKFGMSRVDTLVAPPMPSTSS